MDFFLDQIEKRKEIIKFIISGGTSSVVNFALLYILTDILGFWYLLSSVLSFIASFFVSFFLQKFWTFEDTRKNILYGQMVVYLWVALSGLVFNIIAMYVLVDAFKIWYMLAQFIISCFIALCNFMAYKFFIFKPEVLINDK